MHLRIQDNVEHEQYGHSSKQVSPLIWTLRPLYTADSTPEACFTYLSDETTELFEFKSYYLMGECNGF